MRRSKSGYTVIEVLMFLAISGALFTIAYFGTRNTQDSVAIRDSLQATEIKIREIFNNVDNGYFGNAGQYSCALNGDGFPVISYDADETSGGSSNVCIFLGKEIIFADDNYMTLNTLVASRAVPDNINASAITENYNFKNSVSYLGSSYDFRSVRKPSADDVADPLYTDDNSIRATRQILINTAWTNIQDDNAQTTPRLCFGLGDKRGSITIFQKDVKVDYSGEGC